MVKVSWVFPTYNIPADEESRLLTLMSHHWVSKGGTEQWNMTHKWWWWWWWWWEQKLELKWLSDVFTVYLLPSEWTPNLQMWLRTSMSTPWAWAEAPVPARTRERRREVNILTVCPAPRVRYHWALTQLSADCGAEWLVWRGGDHSCN